jgi:EAL and modified HD-GYP domain-containing signal transduction protein
MAICEAKMLECVRMPSVAVEPKNNEGTGSETAGSLRFVVRQPILDLRGRDHAYELLFRPSPELDSGESACQTMLENTRFFGLEKPHELKKLTGGLRAFVKCPVEALASQLAQHLPPNLTVLEIPQVTEPAPELIETCRELKAMGFRLALNNFTWSPESEPLVESADYVKVDFARSEPEARRKLLDRLRDKPIAMLAMQVDSQAEYKQAREEGFTLFEGYYFCQPPAMKNRRPPTNQLLRIEILQALQKHPIDLPKVSESVKRDGPLTYQLLRLVNSPLWALREPVQSIQKALMVVGDDAFRRIALMAIASEFNGDQPPEILLMAMVRGRFCETAGLKRDLDPFGQYLLGLLSLLPAMQGQPMRDVVPALPLSKEIRDALLEAKNRERVLLGWLENYERGNWDICDAAANADDLNQQELVSLYLKSVAWAEAALHPAY